MSKSDSGTQCCLMAKDEKVLLDIGRHLAEKTSCHGFSKVLHSKAWICKLIWVILLLSSAIALIVHVVALFLTYLDFGVSISYESTTTTGNKYQFPAVTACNLNPLLGSAVQNSSYYPQLISALERTQNSSSKTPPGLLFFNKLRTYKGWLLQMGIEERMSLSQDKHDFLLDCVYEQGECDFSNDFTQIFVVRYGNCFTFNHGLTNVTPRTFHGSVGVENGLRLQFYVNSAEYLSEISPVAGVRVQIHEPGTLASPEMYGINIPVGTSSSVGIMPVEYSRKKSPYKSNCTDSYHMWTSSFTLNATRFNYTSDKCIDICRQQLIIDTCQCIDAELTLTTAQDDKYSALPYCDYGNSSIHQCLRSAITDASGRCHCNQRCLETMYGLEISYGSWPADNYQSNLLTQLSGSGPQLSDTFDAIGNNQSAEETFINENVAELYVYYRTLTAERLTDQIYYSWETLFSDIGGQMGLWMGMSILTLCEFGEFVMKIVTYFVSDKRKPRSTPAASGISVSNTPVKRASPALRTTSLADR